jgi:AraC-like DNA-binding protein
MHSVARIWGKNMISFPQGSKGFSVHANHYRLGAVGISYATHGNRVRIELPTLGSVGYLLSYGGSAEATVGRSRIEVRPDQAYTASAGEMVKLDYAANFEQLAVKIDAAALAKKLEAIGGQYIAGDLQFEPTAGSRNAGPKNLRRMVQFLLRRVDADGSPLSPVALAELEQAIMVSFLLSSRHNYSDFLDRQPVRSAPWQVHLAEEYITAHWDQPITIEALSIVTGCSGRSIFHSFKHSRGYSPMDFLKDTRLDHSKKMLSAPEATTSVTDVAFACGFGNLGHFSGYYREKFGEVPSNTLTRARSGAGRKRIS